DAFAVVDVTAGDVLRLVERSRAYSTVHEGAGYLHRGESFLVRELDEAAMPAILEPVPGDWFPPGAEEALTSLVRPLREERRLGLPLAFGEIEVTEQVVAYERKTIRSQERIEVVPLVLPPSTFPTEAIWFVPEPAQLAGLDEMPRLLAT